MPRQIIVKPDTKILRLGGRPPKAISILMGIHLGLFLLYVFAGGPAWVRDDLALSAAQALGLFQLWQPISAIWLHLDARSLIVDLLALWVFGCALYRWWGHRRFLVFYLTTAVVGLLWGLMFGLLSPKTQLWGSEGAAVALILACGVIFPTHLVHLHKLLGMQVRVLAAMVGGFLLLGTLVSSDWLQVSVQVGGGLCGLLFINPPRRLWGQWRLKRARKRLKVIDSRSDSSDKKYWN